MGFPGLVCHWECHTSLVCLSEIYYYFLPAVLVSGIERALSWLLSCSSWFSCFMVQLVYLIYKPEVFKIFRH